MKLSDEQIKETIECLNAPQDVKDALVKQCLEGDQGARFYVYSKFIKRNSP